MPLGPGSSGEPVADLHRRLAALGYRCDGGEYGPLSADAVRRFQADRGLRVDGLCGDQTWAALKARYDTAQLMDLVFTVGNYTTVSMALNTFGVRLDDGIEGFGENHPAKP